MKWSTYLLFVSLLPAAAPGPASSDDVAIREIVQKYLDARQENDPAAVEALFTADADQLVSSGEWRKGRAELVKGTLASSQRTGGQRTISIQSIRFLVPDVALADGRYTLTGLANGAQRSMWTTVILKREQGGWRIAAIRNMLPAAPAPSK